MKNWWPALMSVCCSGSPPLISFFVLTDLYLNWRKNVVLVVVDVTGQDRLYLRFPTTSTLCLKKLGACILRLITVSPRCGPILMILSVSHSLVNCRKGLNKIFHLTSNLLPHYLVKIECSTVQLCSTLFNANVMQNRLFTILV